MKLSLTLHGKTYSVESEESFDGSNVYDLAEQFKGLLVSAGFHPSNVDSIFNLDYQWFTDEENANNMQGHLTGSNKIVENWYKECANETDEVVKKRVEEFQNNMYKS